MIGIGYEGLSVQLVARLQAAGVGVLADVRMTHLSRKPGFSWASLHSPNGSTLNRSTDLTVTIPSEGAS